MTGVAKEDNPVEKFFWLNAAFTHRLPSPSHFFFSARILQESLEEQDSQTPVARFANMWE